MYTILSCINILILLTEQEFAKNVMKTAEGAKANVGQQVGYSLCFYLFIVYQ